LKSNLNSKTLHEKIHLLSYSNVCRELPNNRNYLLKRRRKWKNKNGIAS
jgi:hypothetical protein